MEKTIVHPVLGEILYVKRLKSKTLKINISPVRGIRVSMPFFVPYAQAQKFVDSKVEEIEKIRQKQLQRRIATGQSFGRGVEIQTIGRKIVFDYAPENQDPNLIKTCRYPDRYEILYPRHWDELPACGSAQGSALKEGYLRALRKEAKELLFPKVEKLAGVLRGIIASIEDKALLEPVPSKGRNKDCRGPEVRWFDYKKIALKNNRSNWGSCSVRGNLNLNIHLIELPEDLADFVIVHELCHLVHHNHSPRFHALVNAVCAGKEKELEKRLRSYHLF